MVERRHPVADLLGGHRRRGTDRLPELLERHPLVNQGVSAELIAEQLRHCKSFITALYHCARGTTNPRIGRILRVLPH